MKYIITTVLVLVASTIFLAQESKWPKLDPSVLDTEYFPAEAAWRNYLSEDKRNISPQAKVVYSRPLKKGRKVFGELVKYGEEWRLGANEATLVTFYQPVDIGGSTVNAGTYSLFATVNPNSWTFHLSSETILGGNANRDMNKTVASVEVKSNASKVDREALSMTFQEVDDRNINLVVEWEKTRASMPISFTPIMMNDIDPSPMDMAHYPPKIAYRNYLEGDERNLAPKIQVTYSRPQKKGRNIFGDLLKEGSVWRIGANEATEILLHQDVSVGGSELKKGRYAMFAKLNGANWDIIFSKDYPIWGAANRDEKKDAVIVRVPVTTDDEVVEALSIIFEEKSSTSCDMVIGWDRTRATIPFSWSE